MTTTTQSAAARILAVVQAECPEITTIATRNSDALDFHNVTGYNLRAMIRAVAPRMDDKTALAIVRVQAPEITTLVSQRRDARDFHQLAIWTILAIVRNAMFY